MRYTLIITKTYNDDVWSESYHIMHGVTIDYIRNCVREYGITILNNVIDKLIITVEKLEWKYKIEIEME